MEGKHVQLIFISVSGSFRENTDGNSGFYFVYCGQDRFESLFDVFPVKEETVEITHPCGKKRNFLHLFFGNVACTDRTAGVSKKYVEVASVVADIKYRCVLSPITVIFAPVILRINRNTAWMILRELISFFSGENLPMIHSTSRMGMDRIRYPITTIQTRINRIIR